MPNFDLFISYPQHFSKLLPLYTGLSSRVCLLHVSRHFAAPFRLLPNERLPANDFQLRPLTVV